MTGADLPRCPDCVVGHDHCHATLIVHSDGGLECVGSVPCEEIAERHPLVVDCRELHPPCGCAGQPAAPVR